MARARYQIADLQIMLRRYLEKVFHAFNKPHMLIMWGARYFCGLICFRTSCVSNLSHSGHTAGSCITMPVAQCQHVNLYFAIFSLVSISQIFRRISRRTLTRMSSLCQLLRHTFRGRGEGGTPTCLSNKCQTICQLFVICLLHDLIPLYNT